jgi:hypothetical protein
MHELPRSEHRVPPRGTSHTNHRIHNIGPGPQTNPSQCRVRGSIAAVTETDADPLLVAPVRLGCAELFGKFEDLVLCVLLWLFLVIKSAQMRDRLVP